MKTLKMGDMSVGAIAYGCWRFAGTSSNEASLKVHTALEVGMNLIDTADVYGFGQPCGFGGAESLLGDVLRLEKGLRARLIIATKGGVAPPRPYDSRADYLGNAVEASLRRLGIDHIDLYQIHRPDLTTPFHETANALNRMMRDGKVRHVGVSNFTVAQTRALQAHLDSPLVSTQPEFSAVHQEPIFDGTLDWCGETRACCLAWSPLGGGLLATGPSDNSAIRPVIDALDHLSKVKQATRAQVALAFLMHHQADVIPIIGSQQTERIREASGAVQVKITGREFYDLIEAFRDEAMP